LDVGIELGIGKLELYIFDTMCLDALEFDPQFHMVFSQQQTTRSNLDLQSSALAGINTTA
jgi:hypothetical protein